MVPCGKRLRRLLGSLVAFVVAGCGGDGDPTAPRPVARFVFAQPAVRLEALGATASIAVQALDAAGRVVPDASIVWTSGAPDVFSVTGGLVTALSNGEGYITAAVGALRDSVRVTVSQVAVGLLLAPQRDTLFAIGDTLQVTARGRDALGVPLAALRSARFTSSAPSVLEVSADGLLTARGTGSALITAVDGSLRGERTVHVRQRSTQLRVIDMPSSLRAGSALPTIPTLAVVDARGVPNASDDSTRVTVRIARGPALVLTGETARASRGVIRFPDVRIGGPRGPIALEFVGEQLAPLLSDTIVLQSGEVAELRAGPSRSAPAGTTLEPPVTVDVVDAWGNPVSGANVAFSVVEGDASLNVSVAVSNASGRAGVPLTLGRQAGRVVVRAVARDSLRADLPITATPNGTLAGVVTLSPATAPGRVADNSEVQAIASSQRREVSSAAGGPTRRLALAPPNAVVPDEHVVVLHSTIGAATRGIADGSALRNARLVREAQRSLQTVLERELLRADGDVLGVSPLTLSARIRVRDTVRRAALLARLRAEPRVRTVEPNRQLVRHAHRVDVWATLVRRDRTASHAFAQWLSVARWRFAVDDAFPLPGLYPADARFVEQAWHYNSVRLPQAWQITRGSADVLVAVIDDGIRFDHPALAGRLTTDGYDFASSFQVPRCGGAGTLSNSADGDGYDPDPTNPVDWNLGAGGCLSSVSASGNHGLHVAATIAATPGNATGLVGGTAFTRIRPIRALGLIGGTSYDVAQAVLYAAGLPADDGRGGTVTAAGGPAAIINMSLGGGEMAEVLRVAVQRAEANGVLLIASAGNTNDDWPNYPAAHPEVIAVSAVAPSLQRATYSSFGPVIELAAPGGQTALGSSYGVRSATWNFLAGEARTDSWNGTSMAAPHVAAVAALLKAAEPSLDRIGLRARLANTATDLGAPGRDPIFGVGLVNAERALRGEPTRRVHVVLRDAATGAVRARTRAAPDGAFAFESLPNGRYWLFAGTDAADDGVIGVPGRRWGAAGRGAGPTEFVIDGAGMYEASFTLADAAELEPNDVATQANVLLAEGSVRGTINGLQDVDWYTLYITEAGPHRIMVTGQVGACGYALEADPALRLESSAGDLLAAHDDIDAARGNTCAQITRDLAVGTYRVRVAGVRAGRYQLRAMRTP